MSEKFEPNPIPEENDETRKIAGDLGLTNQEWMKYRLTGELPEDKVNPPQPRKMHVDKVVGVPQEHQRYVKDYVMDQAQKYGPKIKKDIEELEKTEHDIELINFAINAVDEFMAQYGRKKVIEIPLSHIHLLKEGGTEIYSKGKLATGSHNQYENKITVDRSTSDINFVMHVFHELVHAKSYNAQQVPTIRGSDGGFFIIPYRAGFKIVSRDGKISYFGSVDEAFVSFLERKFYKEKIEGNELFKKELENGYIYEFSRNEEVEQVNKIIEDLFEKNKDKFKNSEEIRELFIKSSINGRLLEIARLVEDTYGKGSFREYANKDKITHKGL